MKANLKLIAACAFTFLIFSAETFAASVGYQLEARWVEALQVEDADERVKILEGVLQEAVDELAKSPDDAELLIVKGNSKLEIANALNSMKSLGYLKEGRKDLEQAIDLAPMAMDGMAEASLASVVYWAPGWPLSFGDKKKGLKLFDDAMRDNPDSLEILTQFGHAMSVDGEKNLEQARSLFEAALKQVAVTEEQGRKAFSQFRENEIKTALEKL